MHLNQYFFKKTKQKTKQTMQVRKLKYCRRHVVFFSCLVKFKWSFHVDTSVVWVGCGGGRHLLSRSQLKRLSALGPRSSSHKGSCLNTHTHLLIRRHTPCMYSMVRNDILTKHTQAAAARPESRTGRHRWSFLGINCMSSCPPPTPSRQPASLRQ